MPEVSDSSSFILSLLGLMHLNLILIIFHVVVTIRIFLFVLGIREPSVFLEHLDIFLQRTELFEDLSLDLSILLIVFETSLGDSLTIFPEPEPKELAQDEEQSDDNNDAKGNVPFLVLIVEERADTQQNDWDQKECNSNVKDWETSPPTSGGSKTSGPIQRNDAHEREGIPDEDTREVEKEMGKCNLHGGGATGYSSGQDAGNCGTDVRTQGEGVHLVERGFVKSGKNNAAAFG